MPEYEYNIIGTGMVSPRFGMSCIIYTHDSIDCIVYMCMQGYQLSDRVLIIGILLLMLPVIIILIIWTGFGTNYEGFPLQNEVSLLVPLSSCILLCMVHTIITTVETPLVLQGCPF